MRVTLLKEGRVRESASVSRIFPKGWEGDVSDHVAKALADKGAIAPMKAKPKPKAEKADVDPRSD